jgi:hypothetical protein
MRKVVRAFVGTAISLCLVGALALAAAPQGSSKQSPMRVGDFAVELARAMNLKVDGPLTGVAAKKALGDLGINLGDVGKTLTEGELVTVLGQVGVKVRTADPSKSVSTGKVGAVLRTFKAELTKASSSRFIEGNGGDDFNNGNGKGGKFKRKANLSPGGKGDD